MIQPFVSNTYDEDEISILALNGQKSRILIQKYICTWIAEALAACSQMPIYARVDISHNYITGYRCVFELELIEPGLVFHNVSDNGMVFANAINAANELTFFDLFIDFINK
ncbi:unnamed protein product [Adineta ricciae]|uniref:Uncharacterized protein n=1 Tax=Adineta ricciae TaxID=249248 RepID=A0A814G7H6_ADIRI|nr:unnamed protein product [Adineta ricciae]